MTPNAQRKLSHPSRGAKPGSAALTAVNANGSGGSMTAARKLVTATLAMVALVVPAAAYGAQYTVHACGDGNNNSFFGAASDSRMAARSLCAADADGHRLGVAVLSGVSQGAVPVFA